MIERETLERLLPEARRSMREPGERPGYDAFDGRFLLSRYNDEARVSVEQPELDAHVRDELAGDVEYPPVPPRGATGGGHVVARDPGPPAVRDWLPLA